MNYSSQRADAAVAPVIACVLDRSRQLLRAVYRRSAGHSLRQLVTTARIRSNPYRATKAPDSVVRLSPVVIHEDSAEATIAEDRAAERSDILGCSQPA